jgi:thiol-disulfide isomerase/thioredoxin
MTNFCSHPGAFNSNSERFQLLILLVAIVSTGLTACTDNRDKLTPVGDSFPLGLLNQDNNLKQTRVDLNDKTLLINFWATWCTPCRKEMPYLQNLSDDLDEMQVAIIGVSVDDDLNLVKEFLIQHKILYPNYHDQNSRIATALQGIKALPTTVIVSPEGIIQKRISGDISEHDVSLRKLLSQTDWRTKAEINYRQSGMVQ